MENSNPDPPGNGRIVLEVNEQGTSVDFTNMDGYIIAHLFYHALLYHPICPLAMQKAMEMYRKKNLS
jgi:hypothetical protein